MKQQAKKVKHGESFVFQTSGGRLRIIVRRAHGSGATDVVPRITGDIIYSNISVCCLLSFVDFSVPCHDVLVRKSVAWEENRGGVWREGRGGDFVIIT